MDDHTPEANEYHPAATAATQSPQHNAGEFFKEIVRFALIAFVIVVPIRLFIAQPFIVQGASMQPTFESGEYVIVDQLSYRFEAPERGEVVIFRHPKQSGTFLIKRVIGLPGETVHFEDGSVTIFNEAQPEGFAIHEPYTSSRTTSSVADVPLGISEYLVLGDNRASSADSRVWGPLDRQFIVGKAFLRLLPVNNIDLFPGDYSSQLLTVGP